MYIGNGVTKEFPLPEGKDGDIVILRMPGGKGIRMKDGESYTVEGCAVKFKAAVPSGVEVIFDELDADEMQTGQGNGYVVIYADGTMKEVSEDPALEMMRAEKLLEEAKRIADEMRLFKNETVSYVSGLIGAFGAEMDGKMSAVTLDPEAIEEAVSAAIQKKIEDEYGKISREIHAVLMEIREDAYSMEKLKGEMRGIAAEVAEDTRVSMSEKCADILTGIEKLKGIKVEIEETAKKGKSEAEKRYYEVMEKVNTRAGEELEMLRSLRLRLEKDYEILNEKITARIGMLVEK